MSFNDLIEALEQLQPYQTYISIACIVGMIAPLIALAVNKPKSEKQLFLNSLITMIICFASLITFLSILDIPSHHSTEYIMTRDKTHVFFKSKTKYLESATFDIIGEKNNYVYVEYKDDVYKIPQKKFK